MNNHQLKIHFYLKTHIVTLLKQYQRDTIYYVQNVHQYVGLYPSH